MPEVDALRALVRTEVEAALASQLQDAVVKATLAAEKARSKENRWIERAITIIAATLLAAAIAIPTTLVTGHERAHTQKQSTLDNCEASAKARPQGNARAFTQLLSLEVIQDALFPEKRPPSTTDEQRKAGEAFVEAEIKKANENLKLWRPYTKRKNGAYELPSKIKDYSQLIDAIKPVPLLDCNDLVK